MLRRSDALPPLTPQEEVETLIRQEVEALPNGRRRWDRTTMLLGLGALAGVAGLSFGLGVTLSDIRTSISAALTGLSPPL